MSSIARPGSAPGASARGRDLPWPLPLPLPWYLVGLPGSGKSRVGKMIAQELGVQHVDTDRLIVEKAGKPIPLIFEEDGEEGFRRIEAEVIKDTGALEAVVSLGGGAVETPEVLHFLQRKPVFWVQAPMGELLRRTGRNNKRPLLRKNPAATLGALAQRRNPLYQQVATFILKSSNAPPRKVVDQAMSQISQWETVTVDAPSPYSIHIGPGSKTLVADAFPDDVTNVFFVVPETLTELAQETIDSLVERGLNVTVFAHPEGERAKDLNVVAHGWDRMGQARIGRRDMVVTFGGGATTDMGGFLAATWLRGIRVQHIPTTLLAMVDASIGGKTGINTDVGKNLVGSFYDPVRVTIDTDLLATLPQEEFTSGIAEVLKAGFISDPEILRIFEGEPRLAQRSWATGPGVELLTQLITRAVRVKAVVVGADRLEAGLRETLNYGHTLAHAIEKSEDYAVRHGEAVAVGSVFAAELAQCLGLLDSNAVDRVRTVFELAHLPTWYEGDFDELLWIMRSDKKVRSDRLRFVLLDGEASAQVQEIDEETLRAVAPKIGIRTGGKKENSDD